MNVTKRDGRLEPLNLDKIREYTRASTDGISDVTPEELEVDASINFYDGIRTADIQKILVLTATQKIDVDKPNWKYVAGRLYTFDKRKQYSHAVENTSFEDYIKRNVKANKFNDRLLKYNLKEMESFIDHDRDMQYTYLAVSTFHDRYIDHDSNGRPLELLQYALMANAMVLASIEKDRTHYAKKIYDKMSKNRELMFGTPTTSNARKIVPQMSSCYIGSTQDNLTDIQESESTMAQLSKRGGGIGWDYSDVRSSGSDIDGNSSVAGGVVPFLKKVNSLSNSVDQLGEFWYKK